MEGRRRLQLSWAFGVGAKPQAGMYHPSVVAARSMNDNKFFRCFASGILSVTKWRLDRMRVPKKYFSRLYLGRYWLRCRPSNSVARFLYFEAVKDPKGIDTIWGNPRKLRSKGGHFRLPEEFWALSDSRDNPWYSKKKEKVIPSPPPIPTGGPVEDPQVLTADTAGARGPDTNQTKSDTNPDEYIMARGYRSFHDIKYWSEGPGMSLRNNTDIQDAWCRFLDAHPEYDSDSDDSDEEKYWKEVADRHTKYASYLKR